MLSTMASIPQRYEPTNVRWPPLSSARPRFQAQSVVLVHVSTTTPSKRAVVAGCSQASLTWSVFACMRRKAKAMQHAAHGNVPKQDARTAAVAGALHSP